MSLPVDRPLAGPPAPPPCAAALAEIRGAGYEVANVIEGREVRTGRTMPIVLPHQHSVQLGQVHCASPENVGAAIESATKAAHWWGRLDWEERAAPFARAADMLEAGPWRDRLVAAAMLELSKTWREAEGDAAAETIDLIRVNIKNMLAICRTTVLTARRSE
jgi:1-pyrroline-5-carboxylate dehydrogenase